MSLPSCSSSMAYRTAKGLATQRCRTLLGSQVQSIRSASTSSFNPSSVNTTPSLPPVAPLPPRQKPVSPSYYTGRPAYIDTLLQLEELTRQTKRLLEQSNLVPRNSAPPQAVVASSKKNLWLSPQDLRGVLGTALKASQYRQIVTRLALLSKYKNLVHENLHKGDKNQREFAAKFDETLAKFMRDDSKKSELGIDVDGTSESEGAVVGQSSSSSSSPSDAPRVQNEKGHIDEMGRAYSRGRRKESSARVWLVPVKGAEQTSQILINNQTISEYFTRTSHREAVLWPFKLTGTIGAYNVFALTRGGGSSGQAGAIAHATANALVAAVAHAAEKNGGGEEAKKKVKEVLMKDGVLKRDPRMVERKKTGLAKARKAFTWVKR
ncbi:ribosomal protein S5 domain 2-like protein [Violaceomyces palustris]|uniref:Ribosomal protein S5 domain 2-like protein n=1 Tax=Violaceomyces palustris TaxID=1673888 RepID=A0ACD0NSH2_9BASI|nr:ribosomal protein S5 domain 2-like protein [Violaceomyces palustris]